ncbi:MAG: tRNA pseudouridine(38-40) synthase TruA [Bacillota bacterium]|nr:tRNA pseudouridine(38-40) synthase TruA [Bacillota bacterium]
MERRNLLLTIEYDGSGFSGWQRQPGKRTVQGELERVLSVLCGGPVELAGTSRTDAGVHALAQRAAFSGEYGIPTERIGEAANRLLTGGGPGSVGDVRILHVEEVPEEFHPRFGAAGKKYIYKIRNAPAPDVFLRNYCYQVSRPLDAERMRRGALLLEGTHDFRSFMAAGGTPRENTVRTLYRVRVEESPLPEGGAELSLEVRGDGFLYNMVRILTGTLVEVGLGKREPEELPEILKALDRGQAGHTAPPQGLYLAEVYFDKEALFR